MLAVSHEALVKLFKDCINRIEGGGKSRGCGVEV